MKREPWHRLTSLVGRWAIAYLEHVPAHRGQSRIINDLGRALGPVPLACTGGAELLVRLESMMDRSFVLRNRLDHDVLLGEIAALRPGEIVVDVGANAGLYTILAARAVAPAGRVLAFEPSADEFARLSWAVAAGGFGNIIASNVALAERPGFVGFMSAPREHTGLHRLAGVADATSHRVWAERGDSAVHLGDGEHIALLKIDVEGAELSVLRGFQALLKARRIERLVIEVTDDFLRRFATSSAELYAYLDSFGYRSTRGPLDDWQYDEVFVRS
jgi:FkbM family methyltransferase